MATFTSVQTGNWADGATWGNTSPGSAGTDFPGANNDVVVIAASHVVTYNAGDSAITYGNITISGTLTFPVDANSTLKTNTTALIQVNNGGSFLAGSSTTPIGAAYKCRIEFGYTTTDRTCFDAKDGAIVEMYGDPDYYGDEFIAPLNATWSSGQSFDVTGDFTSWNVGDRIVLFRNQPYYNYTTGWGSYTIASTSLSGGVTTITINESAPGVSYYKDFNNDSNLSACQGKVFHFTRNVYMGTGSDTNGLDLTLDLDQTTSNNLKFFECVEFNGFEDTISSVYNINFNKCSFFWFDIMIYGLYETVMHNCVFCKTTTSGSAFSVVTFAEQSNNHLIGIYTAVSTIFKSSANVLYFYQCLNAYNNLSYPLINLNVFMVGVSSALSGQNCIVSAIMYGVTKCIDSLYYSRLSIEAYEVQDFTSGSNTGTWISGSVINASDDIDLTSTNEIFFTGTLYPDIDNDISGTNAGGLYCYDVTINGVYYELYYYSGSSELYSITSTHGSWQAPDSEFRFILVFAPNTDVTSWSNYPFSYRPPFFKTAVGSGDTTATIKIWPVTWSNPLSTGKYEGLVFNAIVPKGTGVLTETINNNENATLTTGSWQEITFTFNAQRDGWFEWFFAFIGDENAVILIDPVVVIS